MWSPSMQLVGPLSTQTSAQFLDVAKKSLLSENTYDILTRAGPKTLPKKCEIFGTGFQRGATPGRLGAQN